MSIMLESQPPSPIWTWVCEARWCFEWDFQLYSATRVFSPNSSWCLDILTLTRPLTFVPLLMSSPCRYLLLPPYPHQCLPVVFGGEIVVVLLCIQWGLKHGEMFFSRVNVSLDNVRFVLKAARFSAKAALDSLFLFENILVSSVPPFPLGRHQIDWGESFSGSPSEAFRCEGREECNGNIMRTSGQLILIPFLHFLLFAMLFMNLARLSNHETVRLLTGFSLLSFFHLFFTFSICVLRHDTT